MTGTKVLYKPISDLIDDYEIYCCGEHARGCVGEIPKAELAAVGVPVFDRDDFVYAIAYGEILAIYKNIHGAETTVAQLDIERASKYVKSSRGLILKKLTKPNLIVQNLTKPSMM